MVTQPAAGSGNDEWHQKTDKSMHQLFKIREGLESYLNVDLTKYIKTSFLGGFFVWGYSIISNKLPHQCFQLIWIAGK